ncbi:MAG: dihydroorotate dehydrogenase-like protein [Acidimicrobiales bacterium]|nr:dihydroorotate dehydrogenase-like protein [Acidimicrobiales bacterium]
MTDLRTSYLGLDLRSPIVASASPLTGDLDVLARLEAAGAAAVVLPSLFEEQVEHDLFELQRVLDTGAQSFTEASDFFPELDVYNTGPERYLTLVERAKERLSVPVIASLNGTTAGGWIRYAHLLQNAGADALELNLYVMAADPAVPASAVEETELELVAAVSSSVDVPVAVKLGPFYSSLPNFATRVVGAGARGLVLFNRFYQPDLDLERLEVAPRVALSTSEELRLPLRWIGVLHGHVDASLAATTGIHTGYDAAKLLLAGADVVMLASALLRNGPEHVGRVEATLLEWMATHEYESVGQLRGSVSQRAVADPSAYLRANYLQTLASYSSPFLA